MGNAGSSSLARERNKSSSTDMPSSPVKDGQTFDFEKHLPRERHASTTEEEEPYYTKPATAKPANVAVVPAAIETTTRPLQRSESSVSMRDGAVIDPNTKDSLPTVVSSNAISHS